jgi:hypothetical protein
MSVVRVGGTMVHADREFFRVSKRMESLVWHATAIAAT